MLSEIKIGAVAMWYQFVLAKFSYRVKIAKAIFLINLAENPHILPCFALLNDNITSVTYVDF